MDNQTNNIINQPLINPNPVPPPEIKASPLTKATNWINNHRKLALTILASIVLAVFLILTLLPAIKNKLFKKPATPQTTVSLQVGNSEFASITVNSSKTSYALTEKIPVSVKAQTSGTAVTAFDVVLEYDPEFLTLTKRNPPPLADFTYFGKNNNQSLSVSAIQKPTSSKPQIFDNTTLFEIEFTPKKAGKTTIKVVYMPNSTNDSNLLNSANKDILSGGRGVEIEIK